MYNCILVSLDGSLEAEAVLWEVEKLVKSHPAKVVLLEVAQKIDLEQAVETMSKDMPPGEESPGEEVALLTHASEADARQYLEPIAHRLEKAGATPLVEVSFNKATDEILFFSHQYHADLIAMATHGRSGINRLLQGSVTENVLHRAPCPMLVVRIPDQPHPRFAESQNQPVPARA